MAAVDPPLVVKPVILKNLYRNGNPIKMMFRNGELIYRMLQKLVFNVDTDSIFFDASGNSTAITITANDNWTMTVPNWITASALSGTTSATITLTASSTEDVREGQITITCGRITHTISVEQGNYAKQYLTIEALENGSFYIRKASIDYSINGGSWQTTAGSTTISLSSGDKVRFRSTATRAGNNLFTGNTIAFNVYGNLMSLQNGDNFENQTAISLASGFSYCLSSCSNLKDASNLVLPATTLSSNCYRAFFYACINLEVGPKILPATTLATYCYRSMYQDCDKIQVAPELPAPTLVQQCYYNMFGGCDNLNYVKCLATSISATDCRTDWMNQVQTTSGTFVKSPNITTSTWGSGASGIPSGWTVEDAVI